MKSKSISFPYSQSIDRGKPFSVSDFSYSCVASTTLLYTGFYFINCSYVFIKETQHFLTMKEVEFSSLMLLHSFKFFLAMFLSSVLYITFLTWNDNYELYLAIPLDCIS